MKIEPYLSFEGRCEEAIEFYKQALGAQVEMLMRFKDSPEPPPPDCPPSPPEGIMHASLMVGESRLMLSDGMNEGTAQFKGIALSITANSVDEANRIFNALSDGGQVQMPMAKTFWSPAFGMLADRFGVAWMVMVAA
jgi:PhnB protein